MANRKRKQHKASIQDMLDGKVSSWRECGLESVRGPVARTLYRRGQTMATRQATRRNAFGLCTKPVSSTDTRLPSV